MKDKVVLVKGTDRREMVRKALTIFGDEFRKKVKKAKKIFIHPNLVNYGNPYACTDKELVRGIVDHISLIRGDQILIGDAGYHDTKEAFKVLDYPSLRRSGNIKLIDLNDDKTTESFAYTSDLKKRPIGFSKTVTRSDLVIIAVPAKMHSYYTVSLSLKTHIVGSQIVPKSPFGIHARWPWVHTGYKSAHLTLTDVYQEHPAQLAIIDGTQAMQGNGPSDGETINLGWIIVSFNPIAADLLASYLMGFDPKDIGYLLFLHQKGFSPIDVNELNIIGPDPKSLRKKLQPPDSYPEILDWK
ncbi:DUF362 domain-containing protein [Candidatus Roizmanbacteria bacterium]|nr:DUF362 domain-containing protein [Candidatus Roizmanbacteria bacterium]